MELTRVDWRTSTYSSVNGGECVEVGTASRRVAVRDSKKPDGPKLSFAPSQWREFTRRLSRLSRPRTNR
jgi:Domain of unknown function (DUF397)